MKSFTHIACVVVMLAASSAFAQVATGNQAYGSFSAGPDVTNLGNLTCISDSPYSPNPAVACPSTMSLDSTIPSGTPLAMRGLPLQTGDGAVRVMP